MEETVGALSYSPVLKLLCLLNYLPQPKSFLGGGGARGHLSEKYEHIVGHPKPLNVQPVLLNFWQRQSPWFCVESNL